MRRGQEPMPYSLPLPPTLRGWKVKIYDAELTYESPHVTIRRQDGAAWRFDIRNNEFMDRGCSWADLPDDMRTVIEGDINTLRTEWNHRFPNNLVNGGDDERDD